MNQEPLACPVCSTGCSLLDVVDFNKSCMDEAARVFTPSGFPVYYALCPGCGFCFAPAIAAWTLGEFEERIYNTDYCLVDPDYLDARPRANAANLISMFSTLPPSVRHLDYGGGAGLLAKLLCESDWNSGTYDPFVDKGIDPARLGQFDLITAYEVFEHVPDIQRMMSNLRNLLSPNGLVLFSTLLSDGNLHPGQRINWWYASPRNGHISLFSRKSLALLAQNSGFNCASFSAGFHVFFTGIPPWASHLFPSSLPRSG
jgi:SAM-dependent methyltransferase